MTLGTPSLNLTATSGRAVTSRFAKIALPATLAALVDAAVSEAVVALAEASVLAEALALVAASAAASGDVEVLVEAMVVALADRLAELEVSTPPLLPTHRTPSPTSLRQAVSPATSSTFVTYLGPPATRTSWSCSPRSARSNVLRSNTSPTVVLAEPVLSNLRRAQMLKPLLVRTRSHQTIQS